MVKHNHSQEISGTALSARQFISNCLHPVSTLFLVQIFFGAAFEFFWWRGDIVLSVELSYSLSFDLVIYANKVNTRGLSLVKFGIMRMNGWNYENE